MMLLIAKKDNRPSRILLITDWGQEYSVLLGKLCMVSRFCFALKANTFIAGSGHCLLGCSNLIFTKVNQVPLTEPLNATITINDIPYHLS